MKLSEFAKRIGVSEQTLRNWDKSGKLVAKRTKGNHRFYTEDDYNNYMGISNKNKKEVSKLNDVQAKWLADFIDSMSDKDDKEVVKKAIEAKWEAGMSKEEAKKIAKQAIIENWIKEFVDSMSQEDWQPEKD